MTDPEDGWGDLARELGLDPLPRQNPPAAAQASAPAALEDGEDSETDPLFPAGEQQDLFQEYEPDGDGDSEAGSDLESESDDGSEEGPEGDGGTGGAAGEPGEDGQKRKRRRRRRRKAKKGGEPDDAPAVGATAGGESDDGEEGEEEAGEADETDAPEPADDGGPSIEASRELIANWDVPSWEQIVAGLYRPGGR